MNVITKWAAHLEHDVHRLCWNENTLCPNCVLRSKNMLTLAWSASKIKWNSKTHGLLGPIPVPTRPWKSLSIDYIMALAIMDGCGSLWW